MVEVQTDKNVTGDAALQDTAMSASTLSAMSFDLTASLQISNEVGKQPEVSDATYASSSSSTCTRESDAGVHSDGDSSAPQNRLAQVHIERGVSQDLNAKIVRRQTSRQGRLSQRWITESNELIRLTTGCVPILKGGKIMLVSASRKPEWILPKGGWELDESMEESAVRECFEEAGVMGVLGPKLKQIEYETRKAKKRRLEQEESIFHNAKTEGDSFLKPKFPQGALTNDSASRSTGSDEQLEDPHHNKERQSMMSSSYTRVRMTLFPLYVSKVLEKWPEDGRFRKAVDINEAIALLDKRPEFREVLEEVKRRGLHLLSSSPFSLAGSSCD